MRRMLERIAAEANELSVPVMRKLLPVLQDARNELAKDLRSWLRKHPDGAERFTAQQYRKALVAIRHSIARLGELHPTLNDALAGSLEASGALAAEHVRFELQRMAAVFGDISIPPPIDTAALVTGTRNQLVRRYRNSAARYSGRIFEDIRKQFGVGLAKGETFSQMTNRLRRLGGPRGLVSMKGRRGEPGAAVEEIADGLFRRYRFWAERLVRTEMNHAYNVQHHAGIEQLNEMRAELGEEPLLKRWDASLDSRLCAICAGLDRRAVPIGEEFAPGYMQPPAHPNCRCVVTAWDRRWGNFREERSAIIVPKKRRRARRRR